MRTPVVMLLLLLSAAQGASANEKLGLVVRRLADACVGKVLQAGALETVARAGRTATGICTCAAEVEVSTGTIPKEGFDAWASQPDFKRYLDVCTKAGSN